MSDDNDLDSTDLETEIAEVRNQWVGQKFDLATFEVDADKMVAWAEAVSETDPRFTDRDHPDFQAHPNFTSHLVSNRLLPENFPQIGGPRGIDGGKAIEVHQPIRAGDVLQASSTIADIYTKTGRSGTMVFIVHRMSFMNQHSEPVATVDTRTIRNS
ncbi:MAG: FAS1-like dehydratase domain-containing protein [Acidimicrobiales bacterium]